jgi:prepilin-type N-terminal cleavage/methylation domain-containing protein
MKKLQSQFGFTLSEVLIVVAILLILIGALVGFGKHLKQQAQVSLCECRIKVLVAAIEQYYDWHEAFPDPAVNLYQQLYSLPKSRAICQQLENSLLGNTNPEFLDPWGKPYRYEAGMTFPVVESGGPDRGFGNELPQPIGSAADNISSR